MIFSMEKAARDGKIESDICIIGSGAAALSIAKEFLHTETRICILESGDTNIRRNPDPLYEFESPLLPVSLNSRVRTFGGTTTIWSGRWRELDAIDFTARDWVPFSGWPITYDEIEPYYVRALKSLSLDLTTILPRKESIFSAFKDSPITSIAFRFQDNMQRNWGPAFHTSVEQDKNISVYLGAHVTHMDQENRLVKKVHVHTDGGNSFTVRAKFFVLATGGIENPRLLLLSDIGNSTDQVGRYYMDHPKGACGVIEGYHPLHLSDSAFFDNSRITSFGLRMDELFQKENKLLNSHLYLESLSDRVPLSRIADKLLPYKNHVSPVALIRNYLEQAPNPKNRVSLSSELDPLGNKKAKIEWNIGELDKKTIRSFHELLRTELPRLGIGELRSPLLEKPGEFPITQDASHHMGTTRMGIDPHTSVVDSHCRVHSTDNVFIAGSSVFPTSGAAGPTATITALAIRLADYMKTIV